MGFFKNKEEMFKHREKRSESEAERHDRNGNTEKAEKFRESAKQNRDKADKYKGQEGW